MREFLFGRRGERPVTFHWAGHPQERVDGAFAVPGTAERGRTLNCTWDAAPFVAAELGVTPPTPPGPAEAQRLIKKLPGLDEILHHPRWARLRDRPYQVEAALFSAILSWSMCTMMQRLGKTPTALAATRLVGARRTLIVPLAKNRRSWAKAVGEWTGERAVVCQGRRGSAIRIYCTTCQGRGRVTTDDGERQCLDCRMLNGQSLGWQLIDAEHGTCTIHGHRCPECSQRLDAALTDARYVILNPELVIPHVSVDAAGGEHRRDDIPGWCPRLAQFEFDFVIFDEGHQYLRTPMNKDRDKKGQTQNEMLQMLTHAIPQAMELTATPQPNFVRDWFGQVRTLSLGAAVTNTAGKPWKFDTRYCDGQHVSKADTKDPEKTYTSWWAKGTGPLAKTEWRARRAYFERRIQYKDVMDVLPKWQREVFEVDADISPAAVRKALAGRKDVKSKLKKLMLMTAALKMPIVVDDVFNEITQDDEGTKTIVLVYNPESAARYAHEFARQAKMKRHAFHNALDQRNFRVWCTASPDYKTLPTDRRERAAEDFVEHTGAGVFVASIRSIAEGMALYGPTTQFIVDVDEDAGMQLQVEKRAFLPGVTPTMYLRYYQVTGSVDQHRLETVIPKLDAASAVAGDDDAGMLSLALTPEQQQSALEATLSWVTDLMGAGKISASDSTTPYDGEDKD